jgi:hypothetical protein
MRELYLPLRRKLSLVVLIMTAVFAFSVTRPGATQEPARCPNPVYDAQRFLQTLYPETKGKGYTVLFSVGGSYDPAWTYLPRLEVSLLETNYTPSAQLFIGKEARKYKPLNSKLIAYFDFDQDSHIEGVHIAGDSLVNDTRFTRISQLVNAHRNWSDGQVVRALKDAGVKYGPEDKESFLASLPQKDLESLLGRLTIQSVEFHLRHEQSGGPIAELWWIVEADAKSTDSKTQSFTLSFEPFDGKLTGLHRHQ